MKKLLKIDIRTFDTKTEIYLNLMVYQLISICSLIILNTWQPKNPLWALRGDGWIVLNILCFESMNLFLDWANFPINKNTQPEFFSENHLEF